MATAVRVRVPSRGIGPALGRAPLPTTSILVSSLVHLLAVAAFVLAATVWRPQPTKTYIVNLIPAVPAIGAPRGKPATPTAPTPPRVEEPPPRTSKVATPEPPAREALPAPLPPRPAPLPELPTRATRAPEMPARERPREGPALPVRERPLEKPVLPARALPTREPALPRPGQKELPVVASSAPPRPLPPLTSPASASPSRQATAALPPPPPPAPLGRPTGTAQGAGAVLNTGGDFPFTWYLKAVERKVYEKWTQPLRAVDGQEAVVVFEIGRDGQVSRARIEKPSGDPLYDQAALRAVLEANPLPQLPPEFKEPPLRVHFGFTYGNRG
jgi:TonB family protein